MSKPIDTSAEAVAAEVAGLRQGITLKSFPDLADLLEALAADREAAKAKLVDAERERDEALQVRNLHSMFDKSRTSTIDDLRAHLDDAHDMLDTRTAERDAALSELAKLRAAEAHPDATARAVEAFTALRWYRPRSLIAAPEAARAAVALFQHGDVRCVFVNEGDWIMVEMAIAALPSPPKDPAHD